MPPTWPTSPPCWILSEPYAGLQAQALGLAEAADLSPDLQVLVPRPPWNLISARFWPAPALAVKLPPDPPSLVMSVGGMGAAVGAALRRPEQPQPGRQPRRQVVQVQHPRMDPRRFDLVVVNRHDELTGPNVIVTRTALHRVTPERLAQARAEWEPRLAHLPRPLVVALIGGSNGRFRLDGEVAGALADQLAGMMRRDLVGLAVTPSRRTDPGVCRILAERLGPEGAFIWDMQGENPYFGLLALADAVVATMDSVSMVSEAVATSAPVMLARLPGRSRRIGLFLDGLLGTGRVRWFDGRLQHWPAAPLNDTLEAAAEMRRRLGI